MRRLLQKNSDSGAYYAGNGRFTDDLDEALVFEDSLSAIQCCVCDGLTGVQLVLKFEEGGTDIQLPITSPDDSSRCLASRV